MGLCTLNSRGDGIVESKNWGNTLEGILLDVQFSPGGKYITGWLAGDPGGDGDGSALEGVQGRRRQQRVGDAGCV